MGEWITDWTRIDDARKYFVCPINQGNDGALYLGSPIGVRHGWEVKRLMSRCYAAIEFPEFDFEKFKRGK